MCLSREYTHVIGGIMYVLMSYIFGVHDIVCINSIYLLLHTRGKWHE